MAQPTEQPPPQPGLGAIGQFIAFVVCVGFPGFWTLAMPVSWVKFERHGTSVSANAKVCLFFVVPYRNLSVTGVSEIGTRASVHNTSNTTPRRGSLPEDNHFLVIQGDNAKVIEFPVADSSHSSLREKVQTFLEDPQATELKFFAVSHWIGSIFGGGVLSLLTLLYLCNAVVLLIQAVQRRCGVEPQNLFFAVQPETKLETPSTD